MILPRKSGQAQPAVEAVRRVGLMYSKEFRERACSLAEEIGVWSAASKLGLSRANLHLWVQASRTSVLMSKDQDSAESKALAQAMAEAQREIKRLKKENEELKKANWVLKEVSSFFPDGRSSNSLKRSLSSLKKGKKS